MTPSTTRQEETFAEAVLVHRATLMRTAVQMSGSTEEAEDLVQETFLKAFRAFDRLRPDSQTRPWLTRILKNTYISEWRKRRREKTVLREGVSDIRAHWLEPRFCPDPQGLGDRPDDGLGDEVVEALQEVPPPFRTCVLLVDLHKKSYQEAAQMTNQPLGTVQSRLHRGRRILKNLLHDYAHREGYLARAA